MQNDDNQGNAMPLQIISLPLGFPVTDKLTIW